MHLRREVIRFVQKEIGVDWEAWAHVKAAVGHIRSKSTQLRPDRFGVDVVDGDGRDAASVIDAAWQERRVLPPLG